VLVGTIFAVLLYFLKEPDSLMISIIINFNKIKINFLLEQTDVYFV